MSTLSRIRILIVDDHPAVRHGLVATLEPELDFEIVATAASSQEAIEAHRQHRPDITLMDLALERADGGNRRHPGDPRGSARSANHRFLRSARR
jgi:CheY-like chemotaxis protein